MRAPLGECGFESRAFRSCPDGEMEIIPRFYRGVPGSSPGRGAYLKRERKGYPTGDGNRLETGRAVDDALRV